jgi:hypothetical protein
MSLRPRPTAPAPTAAAGPGRTRLQHVLEAGLRAQELKEQAQPPPQPPQVMDVGVKYNWYNCNVLKNKAQRYEKKKEKLGEKKKPLLEKLARAKRNIDNATEPEMERQFQQERAKIVAEIDAIQKQIDELDALQLQVKKEITSKGTVCDKTSKK